MFKSRTVDNLATGRDATAQFQITQLAAAKHSGPIRASTELAPGIMLEYEAQDGMQVSAEASGQNLVRLKANVTASKPRWIALHMKLGTFQLTEDDVVGIMVRSQSPEPVLTRIAIRSKTRNGFVDGFFPKTLISLPDGGVHLDATSVSQIANVPRTANSRDLVMFFPTQSFDIDLLAMRVFIV